MKFCSTTLLVLLLASCTYENPIQTPYSDEPVNIVWIVAEDLSPIIPSFGDSTVITPNLSRLAKEGVCYDRVFSPSGVCAPSRAAIATGMYPTHIGANHMRTGPWFTGISDEFIQAYAERAMPPGITPYQTIPPVEVKMMSEYLRAQGYYCTNNSKEDYQFMRGTMAWDESSRNAHWRNRKKNQPFFSVFNLNVTHESQIWAKAHDSLWVAEDLVVPVPPYLPTTDSAMIDVRRMYSNIKEMDNQVGNILSELEEDGLLDNTVIFWYTDHGGPLPRQKRLTYDSGLRVPMIVRHPDTRQAGTRDGRLVSFIDFAPTALSIAGMKPPEHMDGHAFLGAYEKNKREYIHAASDRFDESPSDRIRAVRDQRYKFIRYYDQELPMFYHVSYRNQQPIMRELYRLKEAGQLTPEQALWFREEKPAVELFDTHQDPYELNNLADDPLYSDIQQRLAEELERWLYSFEDLNMIPEPELLDKFLDRGKLYRTSNPIISMTPDKRIKITCGTPGASLGYRYIGEEGSVWHLYIDPIELGENEEIVAIAHRLGYRPSEEISM